MPGINPQMGAAQMAGGGGGPAINQPAQPPMTTVGGGNTATTQISEIMGALKQILPQVIDEKGYVNMDRLITMWPQISKVPFQVVMQLIQQNPEILSQLITQYGLNGIIIQGRVVGADEMASLGSRGGGGV